MPATRAVASTFPFAMDCDSMSLSVSFCSRISPRATASRSCTGFADTSTMRASPVALMRVNPFMIPWGRDRSDGFLPLFNRRAHLISGIQARLHELGREPRKCSQQISGHQNLTVAVGTRTDADGWNLNFLRQFLRDRRGDEFQDDGKRARVSQRLRIRQQCFTLGL